MNIITFTKENIKLLSKKPYIIRVSDKSIAYSDKFKHLFIKNCLRGKIPKQIFRESGVDIEILWKKRYEQAAHR